MILPRTRRDPTGPPSLRQIPNRSSQRNIGRIAMANFHIIAGADARPVFPVVRKIGLADLKYALAAGIDDFKAMPSHIVFIGLIYPIVGIIITRMAMGLDTLPLMFPLAA